MSGRHRPRRTSPWTSSGSTRSSSPSGSCSLGAAGTSAATPWVGARPVIADALPLVGATRTPGVYVAGGHGMWGVTLGPVTGRLLAEQITTGKQPPELAPFDPLR